MGGQTSRYEVCKCFWNNAFRKIFNACWRESVTPLQFYCSCLPASVLVHQRRILFWLKIIRSDNVILHTLAGCSRDSVVAVLNKYSPTDSHCEPSMPTPCKKEGGIVRGGGEMSGGNMSRGNIRIPRNTRAVLNRTGRCPPVLAVDEWCVTFGTVRRGWAGCGPAQCNSPHINGQCTNHCIAI